MLANFLNRSEPISYISLLFLMTVIVFFGFFSGSTVVFSLDTLLQSSGVWFFFLLVFFFYDFLFHKFFLTSTNQNGLFLWILFLALFPYIIKISAINFAYFFIIVSLRSVLSFRNNEKIRFKLFDSGFFAGVAYLIYPMSIFYLIFTYVGYFLYIKIIDKRLFIPLLGFITPVFLTYTYLMFFDYTGVFKTITELDFNTSFQWYYDRSFAIPFFVLLFFLIIVVLKLLSTSVLAQLVQEQNYKLLIAHLVLSFLIIMTNGADIRENIVFISFPAIIIIGNSMERIQRNWLKELVFYGLFLGILIQFFL